MSAPNDRELNPQPLPPEPPPDVPRRSASPLIWILLLIALVAFGWYFYTQRSAAPPVDTMPPPTTTDAMTPAPETSAEREPSRRAAAAKPAKPRPSVADRDPRPVAQAQPEYPAAAFRAGEEGTVMVRAFIDASGNATNVEIAERSGSRDLDRAARDAVRKWRFEPAIKDGKPVAATVQVPVEFRLERQ